jgi:hypothetical protein
MNLAKLEGRSVKKYKTGLFSSGKPEKLFFSSGHVIVDLDDIRKVTKIRDSEGNHATKIFYKRLPDSTFDLVKTDPQKLAQMMMKKEGKTVDDLDMFEGNFITMEEEGEVI